MFAKVSGKDGGNTMKCMLALMGGLGIWDGMITHFLVGNGLVREGNPLIAPIVGESNFLLLKIIGAIISALLLWHIYKRFPILALATTSSVVIFYGAVMIWNLMIFTGSI